MKLTDTLTRVKVQSVSYEKIKEGLESYAHEIKKCVVLCRSMLFPRAFNLL